MAILDPQRFCQGVRVRARERDQVLIYRLKEDLETTRDFVPSTRGRTGTYLGPGQRNPRTGARREARGILLPARGTAPR